MNKPDEKDKSTELKQMGVGDVVPVDDGQTNYNGGDADDSKLNVILPQRMTTLGDRKGQSTQKDMQQFEKAIYKDNYQQANIFSAFFYQFANSTI